MVSTAMQSFVVVQSTTHRQLRRLYSIVCFLNDLWWIGPYELGELAVKLGHQGGGTCRVRRAQRPLPGFPALCPIHRRGV